VVSLRKDNYGNPAFWIVAIDMEYGGVDHLANVGTI
jgi:hypothetical protein